MSISGRIGLISIVLWIVSVWLISGNEPIGLYLMAAALLLTIFAVAWPDWPGSQFHVTPADIAKTIRDSSKGESKPTEHDTDDRDEDKQ